MGQAPSQYLFFFGDSYTTTGFNVTGSPQPSLQYPLGNPAYPGATLVGGENWVDIVIYNSSIPNVIGYNYAVGGNTVNQTAVQTNNPIQSPKTRDFIDQENIFEYTTGNVPWTGSNSIFINFFGVNDITIQAYQGRDVATSESILSPADIDSYFRILEKQYKRGARKFLAILVPPIHRAPIFNYGQSSNAPTVKTVTDFWNQHITTGHTTFRNAHPDATVAVYDPTPVFTRVLDDPARYGAPNATCYSLETGQPCLWIDFIHPGIVLNREYGREVAGVIKGF